MPYIYLTRLIPKYVKKKSLEIHSKNKQPIKNGQRLGQTFPKEREEWLDEKRL